MDTIQAAILLAKLDIFSNEVQARQEVGSRYTSLIKEGLIDNENLSHAISTPYIEPCNTSVYAQYTVEVSSRDAVLEKMNAQGVPTAVHYPVSLHQQPVCLSVETGRQSYPVSETAASNVISLPMHPYLKQEQQNFVVSALLKSI